MTDTDQSLDLDALLDPARLAAAWQLAHDRPATVSEADDADDGDDAFAAEATDAGEPVRGPPLPVALAHSQVLDFAVEATDAGEPMRGPPLPVALAHSQFLDEIERTLAAVPAMAAKARRVLVAPLAHLAQALEPLDLAAAELALDQLEDAWQALLADAGWPQVPHRDED